MREIDYHAFETVLEEMKAELESNIEQLEEEQASITSEDEVDDLQDLASLESDNFTHIALLKQQRHELDEVNHALAKIQNGTYGICEKSGHPINLERLRIEPQTRYCMEHAETEK